MLFIIQLAISNPPVLGTNALEPRIFPSISGFSVDARTFTLFSLYPAKDVKKLNITANKLLKAIILVRLIDNAEPSIKVNKTSTKIKLINKKR